MFQKKLFIIVIVFLCSVKENGAESSVQKIDHNEICKTQVCIPKCCPEDRYLFGFHKRCFKQKTLKNTHNFSNIPIYFDDLSETGKYLNNLTLIPGRLLDEDFNLTSFDFNILKHKYYITQEGFLYEERPSGSNRFTKLNNTQYCVDYLLKIPKLGMTDHEIRFYTQYPAAKEEDTENDPFISNGNSRLIYLYGPIVVVVGSNIIFYLLTALKIAQIKKQTSVLKSKDSTTHDQRNTDQQRLVLYVKLFVLMGINWLLEIISAVYPIANGFWIITDAYNVLAGLIIFIIFVCKRKIFRLMKKRYLQMKGKEPLSRNVTTSSRTVSSRDDIRMIVKSSANIINGAVGVVQLNK